MSEFKEFEGKSLDAAIAEACAFFDVPREKLEIEIVEDAKSGIFGLVGARKAKVRARKAVLPDMKGATASKHNKTATRPDKTSAEIGEDEQATPPLADHAFTDMDNAGQNFTEKSPLTSKQTPTPNPATGFSNPAPNTQSETQQALSPEEREHTTSAKSAHRKDTPDPAKAQTSRRGKGSLQSAVTTQREAKPEVPYKSKAKKAFEGDNQPDAETGDNSEGSELGLPKAPLSSLDPARVRQVTETMILGLVLPVIGSADLDIKIMDDRVQVQIQTEDSGLLIGREGQNLAAVQYLATRMISRGLGSQVRVQVDAGDYHSRQNSRLETMARGLADKVRASGRSMSTKPLSAYQRRIIHLALQDDPDVQTRSTGEGATKRVVIMRRKES